MKKHEFIDRVYTLLNENKQDELDYDISLQNDLENLILTMFYPSYHWCLLREARKWFLKDAKIIEAVNLKDGSGYLQIPDDFIELEYFIMSGWQKAVTHLYDETDFQAAIQNNKYARGTHINPVAVRKNIVTDNGKIIDAICYYSLPRHIEKHQASLIYIPKCIDINTLNAEDNLPYTKELLHMMSFVVASMVYKVLEKHDIAAILQHEAFVYALGMKINKENHGSI